MKRLIVVAISCLALTACASLALGVDPGGSSYVKITLKSCVPNNDISKGLVGLFSKVPFLGDVAGGAVAAFGCEAEAPVE